MTDKTWQADDALWLAQRGIAPPDEAVTALRDSARRLGDAIRSFGDVLKGIGRALKRIVQPLVDRLHALLRTEKNRRAKLGPPPRVLGPTINTRGYGPRPPAQRRR